MFILFLFYDKYIEFFCDVLYWIDKNHHIITSIGSVGIIFITWLAFYQQYRANEKIKENFELQKFENQFYEMLRLHKENVNEIEVKTLNDGVIKGRETFFEMKKHLENILLLYEGEDENKKILNNESFKKCYEVFFWGVGDNVPIRYKEVPLEEIVQNSQNNEKNIELEEYCNNEEVNVWGVKLCDVNIDKKKGFHHYLGHYYRHLFHMVKFVANQDKELISEPRKLDYLRMVRAQLSNYEQIMLFYNWLSSYGGDWENDENKFFTKYKMIHNLWYNELCKNDFIKEKLKELVGKYEKKHENDTLFEIGDEIDAIFK